MKSKFRFTLVELIIGLAIICMAGSWAYDFAKERGWL